MRKLRIASFAAIATVGCVGSTAARAQALDDKYWVQLSGYWAKVDTDIRVDNLNNDTPGTEIDLEDDLGFDDRELLPALFAGARVGSGIQIAVEYYSLNRDTPPRSLGDIIVDDVTYPVNASVTAGFDTDIYRLTVGWACAGDTIWSSAQRSACTPPISASASKARSAGGASQSVEQRAQDVLAPLPTIGLVRRIQGRGKNIARRRPDRLPLTVDRRLSNT